MDEKTAGGETQPLCRATPIKKRGHQSRATFLLGFLVVVSLWFTFRYGQPKSFTSDYEEDKAKPWSWTDISPSRDLKWQSCYNGTLECARLDVPMDWLDPSDDERVILGVVKLAAKTKQKPFPPVFINPGGPGGSGIDFLRTSGNELQTIVGDNQNLISFDPRGVGISTPRIDCWGTSQTREKWKLQETPVIDERPGLAYDAYARALALSGACEAGLNHTGILRHVSTVYHARDMLEILNKTGHLKLRYWGFSYGTILGGVFAALFPERVERLVSDGNVDYKGWFDIDIAASIADADLIFDAFDRTCHEAGPQICALWNSTPEKIQERRATLLRNLKRKPVIIPPWSRETGPKMPQLITYSKLQHLTRAFAYKPLTQFERMAQVYAALEKDDGLTYYDITHIDGKDEGVPRSCELTETPANMPREISSEPDAFSAIMCSDARPLEETPEEFEAYAEKIVNVSKWTGAMNLPFRACCVGRTVRPKWKFSEEDLRGNTGFPILYIGNIADNVTPLRNAHNNAARFPGSVVLVQNSYGHCSFAAPSICTARHIQAYFQNGTLPEPGTSCDPDYNLFGLSTSDSSQQLDGLDAAVRRLSLDVDFNVIHALLYAILSLKQGLERREEANKTFAELKEVMKGMGSWKYRVYQE